jgi:hypothetical protein
MPLGMGEAGPSDPVKNFGTLDSSSFRAFMTINPINYKEVRNNQYENYLKDIDMHAAADLDHDNDPPTFEIDARLGRHLC